MVHAGYVVNLVGKNKSRMFQQARFVRYPIIEVTEAEKRDICRFTLKNCDVSFANSLRRVMIAEVPTMAIDLVSIEENSGVLQDEIIAHRLGLIPIDSSEIRRYVNKNECKCSESCGKCAAKYTLSIQCPAESNYTVTHFDILAHNQSPPLHPRVEEVQRRKEDILSQLPPGQSVELTENDFGHVVTKLTKNQSIKAELLAFKGIGKIHTKWSPCATATFKYLPNIVINNDMQRTVSTAIKKEIVEACTKGLFRLIPVRSQNEENKDGDFYLFGNQAGGASAGAGGVDEEYNLAVDDPTKCYFDTDCEDVLKNYGLRDFVTITHVPDVFLFTIESSGAMPALQIVKLGLEVLIDKLDHLSERFLALPQVSQVVQGFGRAMPGMPGPPGVGQTSAALDLS